MGELNLKFPGRPDYAGPAAGTFGFVHHNKLCEFSHDINERIAYIKENKPIHELAIRLHHLIYLSPYDCPSAYELDALDGALAALHRNYRRDGSRLCEDYDADRAALYADYLAKRDAMCADYDAKHAALYADYDAKHAATDADYRAKRDAMEVDRAPLEAATLSYIKSQIPDCAWDGTELVFTNWRRR